MDSHRQLSTVSLYGNKKNLEEFLQRLLHDKGVAEIQNLEAAFWTLLEQEPWSPKWHTLKTVRLHPQI